MTIRSDSERFVSRLGSYAGPFAASDSSPTKLFWAISTLHRSRHMIEPNGLSKTNVFNILNGILVRGHHSVSCPDHSAGVSTVTPVAAARASSGSSDIGTYSPRRHSSLMSS